MGVAIVSVADNVDFSEQTLDPVMVNKRLNERIRIGMVSAKNQSYVYEDTEDRDHSSKYSTGAPVETTWENKTACEITPAKYVPPHE